MVLLLCMVLPWLPLSEFVQAAEITHRYVLDTDGIDAGATYLIVNTNVAGDANALKFYYRSNSSRDFQNQQVRIEEEDGVRYIDAGFTNEADCTFQFSAVTTGKITHGNYSIDLDNSRYATGTSGDTLTFRNQNGGQYTISYSSWFRTYYLRYSNSDWTGSTSTTGNTVYLYKLTEHVVGYDVNYDANGATSGTVPAGEIELSPGDKHIVQQPQELRKDIGMDTWLFLCWNTKPDGSGIEYAPGDEIVVNGDLTLYADWYQQTKYTVSMITYLDGIPTDVELIAGLTKDFFAKMEGTDTYIPLHRMSDGTYSAKVTENGTYVIYSKIGDGDYEEVHGHKVVIFNLDGTTECIHHSVHYETDGGIWASGEAPAVKNYHQGEMIVAYDKIPTKQGYRFYGWRDQEGNIYQPGDHVTHAIGAPIVLTALWEETITVTVNVVIDHNVAAGTDFADNRHDLTLFLFRQESGVDLPVDSRILNEGYTYDDVKNITTYTVVFENMPQGVYKVAAIKADYETSFETSVAPNKDQTIDLLLQYAPEDHALQFEVVVNADNGEQALMPQAVNVRVSYWGYDENGVLDWHIIIQQGADAAPSTVMIDENGRGMGMFPVWHYWAGTDQAYDYRVEVTSIVLPDGTIAPVSGDHVTYHVEGSGLYTATVDVINGGKKPTYPDDSDTELTGAYFTEEEGHPQNGMPVVTVDITPMTVTFDAGNGTIEGQQVLVLDNQFRYPSLEDFTAVSNETDRMFLGWADESGNLATNLAGDLLKGNVKYTALYTKDITLTGSVYIDATYEENGQTVQIRDVDRAVQILVVLQKKVDDVYNDIDSVVVDLAYNTDADGHYLYGTGEYIFENLPNDGTQYRVHVLTRNYHSLYNNDQDPNLNFSEEEAVVKVNVQTSQAQVDIHLDFAPDSYQQGVVLNAAQIHPDLRPTGALVTYLYRDLGDIHHYDTISHHTVQPYGLPLAIDPETADAVGFENVWNWHTSGTPYEYQAEVSLLYGEDIPGAYSPEGTAYTENSPFTIVYGTPNNYLRDVQQNGAMLEATLVPKEYKVVLDLNLGGDTFTPVYGLEDYMVDDGSGDTNYAFIHTWSYAESFAPYPYREGYVFTGWTIPEHDELRMENGTIYVGGELAEDVVLVANWVPLTGTDYTIRYLELNTDKVLKQATVGYDAFGGQIITALEKAVDIEGYKYVGAAVSGRYYSKEENPSMMVTYVASMNLMVIYYMPDGSDGYSDQVEANLEISKTAVLEDNGTYTITMDTFTKNNPITTRIQQNKPLDIVLVLDQSGSIQSSGYLDELQSAVENFLDLVSNHGRVNAVDHRIAIVGYAGDQDSSYTDDDYPLAGGTLTEWINTGVFDSNGDFHPYPVQGFTYTRYDGNPTADDVYYTWVDGEYLLMTYHAEYRHLITEEQALQAELQGQDIYGYTFDERGVGGFVKLERNSSGLWLYGNKLLYSGTKFFTYHTDVWTHRKGTDAREIHAYGQGATYEPADGHEGVYTRSETKTDNYQLSIYKDALMPVSVTAQGSGGINPGLLGAVDHLGANGPTHIQYGIEMANSIFAANPQQQGEDRVRVMVLFTDGLPGGGSGLFEEPEANAALRQAHIAKNEYGALVYSIGLYESQGAGSKEDSSYFMNGISSNYLGADDMTDVHHESTYSVVPSGTGMNAGIFYVQYEDADYYPLYFGNYYVSSMEDPERKGYWYYWAYDLPDGTQKIIYELRTNYPKDVSDMLIVDNMVGGHVIFRRNLGDYKISEGNDPSRGFYTTTSSIADLEQYFGDVLKNITSQITEEVVLEGNSILRDIMNQGLVLTDNTQITVSLQKGVYDSVNHQIVWEIDDAGKPVLDPKVSLLVGDGDFAENSGIKIHVYNLDAENPDDPNGKAEYHPHTVDITGYNFSEWYINETHDEGYKMVVTITRVEATDNVEWGRSTSTNSAQSGLWLPIDEAGNRRLLLAFEQPNTVFVERAYVLDYGKEFTLSGWYFDDEPGKIATPLHLDCNIADGMNYFDPENPNTSNQIGGQYGNTQYGNVNLDEEAGVVTYTPTNMNWHDYDQFYVFGSTWRNTVVTQSANANGNLWNKVTVIPANNIYYEDSFVTTESATQNGIQGFVFNGAWSVEGTSNNNVENPEHMETGTYGEVHGWTDSLGNDTTFTDGTAHVTGQNGEMGAQVEFTFTGTGVQVYTRTNAKSGMIVARLYRQTNNGQTLTMQEFLMVDNLAVSGDYYHVPTLSFEALPYGTYTVKIVATAASTDGQERYQYYIDGVRILNPLGNNASNMAPVVQDAYDMELNAVYTEVREILLDYGDFNMDLPDSIDGKIGAVFIDQIKDGQQSGNDPVGDGVPTYQIGTFEDWGPKNEVYLSAGQAIVLKVADGNNYYVGLKSLTGAAVAANVSGIDRDEQPTSIQLQHTTDMYYQVRPVNGYIVIQNGNTDGAILSITNLRTTNLSKPATNGGVLNLTPTEAVTMMRSFSTYMNERQAAQERVDVNGDGVVTNDDVVELMWYALFPQEKSINGDGDINRDGAVTNADVVELMWYVLFPELQSWNEFV